MAGDAALSLLLTGSVIPVPPSALPFPGSVGDTPAPPPLSRSSSSPTTPNPPARGHDVDHLLGCSSSRSASPARIWGKNEKEAQLGAYLRAASALEADARLCYAEGFDDSDDFAEIFLRKGEGQLAGAGRLLPARVLPAEGRGPARRAPDFMIRHEQQPSHP